MVTIQIKETNYRDAGEWSDLLEVETEREAREIIRHFVATDNDMRADGLLGRFESTQYRIKPAVQVIRCIRRAA